MPRRDSGSNKTGFSVCHREMRARRSAPSACLSLIENQVHTLPNDNRNLANEPLDSVKSRIAFWTSMIKQAGILLTL